VPKPKSDRDSWRLQVDRLGEAQARPGQFDARAPSGFDEIVVGKWLHLERMNTAGWWLRLGDREADIIVKPDGTAEVTWREEGF